MGNEQAESTVEAWGPGTFENDAALDFAADLPRDRGIAPVDDALAVADSIGPYDAAVALAAAEMVAALEGRPVDEVPGEVVDWLAAVQPRRDADLARRAHAATLRVRDASALRTRWDESGADSWLASVDDLLRRLDPSVD